MFTKRIPLEATTIEVLHFDTPECNASIPVADAVARFSTDVGADFTSLDVWTNPDAVVAHRVLIGPAIIIKGHRWVVPLLLIVVAANFAALLLDDPPEAIAYLPLIPLALLMLTGIYLLALPHRHQA